MTYTKNWSKPSCVHPRGWGLRCRLAWRPQQASAISWYSAFSFFLRLVSSFCDSRFVASEVSSASRRADLLTTHHLLCIPAHTHTHARTHAQVRAHTHTHTYTHTHTHTRTRTRTRTRKRTRTRTRTRTRARTHAHVRAHTHTHTHTPRAPLLDYIQIAEIAVQTSWGEGHRWCSCHRYLWLIAL